MPYRPWAVVEGYAVPAANYDDAVRRCLTTLTILYGVSNMRSIAISEWLIYLHGIRGPWVPDLAQDRISLNCHDWQLWALRDVLPPLVKGAGAASHWLAHSALCCRLAGHHCRIAAFPYRIFKVSPSILQEPEVR